MDNKAVGWKFFDIFAMYLAYFGSKFVGNDLLVLCGNLFDTELVKIFTLFCICYNASGKDVKIAMAGTVLLFGLQYGMAKTNECKNYMDKTNPSATINNTSMFPFVLVPPPMPTTAP